MGVQVKAAEIHSLCGFFYVMMNQNVDKRAQIVVPFLKKMQL